MLRPLIIKLIGGKSLTRREASRAMSTLMDGRASDAEIAALAVALRIKGETREEIAGFASVMRRRALRLPVAGRDVVDTCGTGGDGLGTLNVSTLAGLVAAGAGLKVAKHGNRSASSRCGSADLLEALGVNIHLTPARSAASLETVGLAFLFAPIFHPALKHAAQARKAIGVRTFFNFVGPLCNPARASRQLIGISEPSRLRMMAEAARDLGVRRALVVHGSDGMDELTVFASSRVASLENGIVREGTIRPEDAGMRRHARRTFRAGGVRESARAALQLLEGRTGAARDLVILNAGATLHVGGLARSLREGVSMAMESLDTGRAAAKLEHLRAFSRADAAAGAGDGTGSGGVKR